MKKTLDSFPLWHDAKGEFLGMQEKMKKICAFLESSLLIDSTRMGMINFVTCNKSGREPDER